MHIPAGVEVDYSGDSPARLFWVRVNGKLEFDPANNSRIVFDSIFVLHGGELAVGSQDEVRTISSVQGRTVSFSAPLQYSHAAPRADWKTSVANYTRNIQVYNENESVPAHRRGHTMFMHSNTVDGFTQPEHGQAFQRGNNILYRPDFDFVGEDQIKYWVTDDNGNYSPAFITINVNESAGTNPSVVADTNPPSDVTPSVNPESGPDSDPDPQPDPDPDPQPDPDPDPQPEPDPDPQPDPDPDTDTRKAGWLSAVIMMLLE